MLISTVFLWLAIAAAFVVSLPCLWLVGLALWPQAAEKRALTAAKGVGKSLLIGLVPLVITIGIVSRLGKGGPGAVIAFGVLLFWGFACADGLATFVGRSVWPRLGETSPWKQTMRGGFVLVGAALLPAVGWVLLLPLIGVLGWGISIRSWFMKSSSTPSEAPATA